MATNHHEQSTHNLRVRLGLAVAMAAIFILPGITQAQTDQPTRPSKLATPLADLLQSFPQQRGAVSKLRAVAPAGFSIESLPKSARDAIRTGMMRVNANAEVQVYIHLAALTSDNINQLQAMGVTVELQEAARRIVQAEVPVARLAEVSELPFVEFVRLPTYSHRHTGSVDTEGDSILRAEQARTQLHLDGTGVFVAAISDGLKGVFATSCAACAGVAGGPISSGDLPDATGTRGTNGILTAASGGITGQSFDSRFHDLEGIPRDTSGNPMPCGFAGAGAEGTALLEIIHDIAPGAKLSFANFGTDVEFNAAVNAMAINNDVVVDDIGFFGSPYDGTSVVSTNTAATLASNTNIIRTYVTSVGNDTDGHYLGAYADSGTDGLLITGKAGHLHLFQATPTTTDTLGLGSQTANRIRLQAKGEAVIFLSWDDPFTPTDISTTNDYDLYLVQHSTGAVVQSSINRGCAAATSQNPVECLVFVNGGTGTVDYDILIQNNPANPEPPKKLNLFIFTPECAFGSLVSLLPPSHAKVNFNTITSSVSAEGDAGGGVISVGAICSGSSAALSHNPSSCNDPNHDQIEYFSSLGPTIDGRIKPDISAIDGVSITGAGSFENPFFGTSAAAPHVAGIAALVLQSAPCLLTGVAGELPSATARTNLRNLLLNNAAPLGSPVPNNTFGFGRADALASANATLPVFSGAATVSVSGNTPAGASVTGSQIGFNDPNTCPLTALQWSGGCGSGGPAATMPCGFGANNLTVAASNNGFTFTPAASVQVVVTNFSIGVAPGSQTVTAGHSATYSVTVSAVGGAFNSPVTLGCALVPDGAACSFNPPTVTPGSASGVSILTVSTTAHALAPPNDAPRYLPRLMKTRPVEEPRRVVPPAAFWLLVGAFATVGFMGLMSFAGMKLSGPPRLAALGAASMALAVFALQMACGGGSTPAPPAPPSVSLAPASLTFAGQQRGTTSPSQAVVLTNTGTSPVSISGVTTTLEFAATNNCGATLNAGASCTINVTFTPSGGGTRTGSLSVSDNATGTPQVIPLSGTGLASTQPGTYSLGITGTSGTLVNSTPVTLVVN